jgi:hypothetical protein
LKPTEVRSIANPNTENSVRQERRKRRNTPSDTSVKSQAEDRLALNIILKRLIPCGASVEEIDGRTHIILPDFIRHIEYDGSIRFVPRRTDFPIPIEPDEITRVKYLEDEQ